MLRVLGVFCVVAALLGGCAKPPQPEPSLTKLSAATDPVVTGAISRYQNLSSAPAYQPMPLLPSNMLAGRTLTVANNAQLLLEPGEVILTFDDGPRPGKTEAVLDTLDAFGVKAAFLMLGSAAERHPELVRAVAERGHTIGTHTFDHTDLAALDPVEAMAEVHAGYGAVAAALAGVGQAPSRFFRFPYLAQTGLIRASAIESDFIILDVDIDSKDYYKDSPAVVMERTLDRLDAQGQGIILFHDIHARTIAMLPDFLEELGARDYKVVTLRSNGGDVFTTPLVTATADGSIPPIAE